MVPRTDILSLGGVHIRNLVLSSHKYKMFCAQENQQQHFGLHEKEKVVTPCTAEGLTPLPSLL